MLRFGLINSIILNLLSCFDPVKKGLGYNYGPGSEGHRIDCHRYSPFGDNFTQACLTTANTVWVYFFVSIKAREENPRIPTNKQTNKISASFSPIRCQRILSPLHFLHARRVIDIVGVTSFECYYFPLFVGSSGASVAWCLIVVQLTVSPVV